MRNIHNFRRPGGGMPSFGPGLISPFIKWMLIINGGVFLLQFAGGGYLERSLGLTPALFFSEFPNLIYTVFTYMFLHSTGSILHLVFNMFALWMFGTEIEITWGTRRFAKFYLLAGLSGGILTLIVHPSQMIPMIGASAAVYGLLVAYWLMFPHRMLYIYFLIPIKVKWAIPGVMLLGFLFGGTNTAHMAHLGGALYGLGFLKLDWRSNMLWDKLKGLRMKRTEVKLEKRRQRAEDVMKQVDAVLDKINEVGLENLTPAERQLLEEASSKLENQKRDSESNR